MAGTGASFNPQCYNPRMTRAQAMAMRTAGTLKENCVVVITDGPTIGTAGNTSPTEIELNPTSPTELGLKARVHTAFDNSPWEGLYDIDLGVAGSITQLTDNRGNTAKDINANAPTVQTQFPWGNVNFKNNFIEESTLTGFATQVGLFNDNEVRFSIVDLTAKTAGTIAESHFINTNVVLGSAGASVTMLNSTIRRTAVVAANIQFNHNGTGPVVFNDSLMHGGYCIQYAGTATLNVIGTEFYGHRSGAGQQYDLTVSAAATGNIVFFYSKINPRALGSTQIVVTGPGTLDIENSLIIGGNIVKAGGATGVSMLIQGSTFEVANITQNASSIGAFQLVACDMNSGAITHNGPSLIQISGSKLVGSGVTTAATATRNVSIVNCNLTGTIITQNRTGGTSLNTDSDVFSNSTLSSSSAFFPITLNGAVNPGGSQTIMNFCEVMAGATVSVTDPAVGANGVVFQSTTFANAASVTSPAGGLLVQKCRFTGGAIVNVGAFTHASTIIDGAFTKTLTASNINKLCNASFDNTI